MYTDVSICNMALDLLDASPIVALDESTKLTRACRRNYAPVRDEVTEAHAWSCAKKRTALAALSEKPAFGWLHAYQLPTDCLRVLPLTYGGYEEGELIPFEIEGRKILTNAKAPLKVRYLRYMEDPSLCTPMMAKAIAARLATVIGRGVTGKETYVQLAEQQYDEIMMKAEQLDALNMSAGDVVLNDWTEVR